MAVPVVSLAGVRALTGTVIEDDQLQVLVDFAATQVEACSAYTNNTTLRNTLATYLTAHYIMLVDPREISAKLMDGTTIAFQQHKQGRGLAATPWGQMAIAADVKGCLAGAESPYIRIMSIPRTPGCS